MSRSRLLPEAERRACSASSVAVASEKVASNCCCAAAASTTCAPAGIETAYETTKEPPAREGPPGRIVTMSSLGGRFGQPFVTSYIATKHGIEGFSEALRREVSPFGIRVVVMAPSAVATSVWDKVSAQGLHRFDRTRYGGAFRWALGAIVSGAPRHGLAPEAVARATFAAMSARRPRLRYAPSARPFLENTVAPRVPARLVDAVFRWRMSAMRDR